jgi:hypothetical protein
VRASPSDAFRPAWWLRSPHLQTIWPTLFRRAPALALRRERVELPDGDFLDLDWGPTRPGPLVLVLHGLEGSSRSRYARGLLTAVAARGWCGVVMHFRGCSGEPNRLPRSYHSGETGDLAHVVARVRTRHPAWPIAVVGYSLGGNVLLKWLGETGADTGVSCAVAVSVPFDLGAAARRLERGVSRLYQWWLLRNLHRSVTRKVRSGVLPPAFERRAAAPDFWTFDDRVTAPLHGFASADEYYRRSSCRQYLGEVAVPTLVLQARDDPFLFPEAIPTPGEVSATVTLEVYPAGGHVGFVAGHWPWAAEYWLERRIPAFLASCLEAGRGGPPPFTRAEAS